MIDHLETDRLILEPLTMTHAPDQFAVLEDAEVSRHIGVFGQPFTLKQAADWCDGAEQFHAAGKGLLCAIFKKAATGEKDGPAIGYVGTAHTKSRPDDGVWEVGYWLAKDHWGKGYVPEALTAVMATAAKTFSLRGFFAELAMVNINSEAVVKKCGFQHSCNFIKNTPGNPERPSYRYEKIVC